MRLARSLCLFVVAVLFPVCGVCAEADRSGPVKLETMWGETRIENTPQRIVSLSYNGGDHLLALGIKPVAIRHWYGGNAQGVWPWAEEALGGHEPIILRGEVDVERVALLKPDLIEALWSGISEDEYRQLSKIAPVLAPRAEYGSYGTPWPVMLKTIGVATGKADEADRLVRELEGRFAETRRRHPGWQGRTVAVGWPGGPGFYTAGDIRGRLMKELGFEIPDALERLSPGTYYINVSRELTELYDTDVLIWLDSGVGVSAVRSLPLRHTMRAFRQGRELVADPLLAAAMSFSSPLSLGYALDRLVPLIEAAVDGDPETRVPSTVAAGLAE
ncbi:iron-siderophore ABC transporter substrate-binding protein [Roseibium aggregatum]|uniref:Iron-siderophore ABC transporter substrate-binding protein n=1 Tax=Roseibium aggregatum TaxID=187304 RepID=A0A939J545_9HYPH|nr:iron-siderophore ABC transporter substrate-binding protein [Roseibium aggregatum]MBN9672297.1 iron-siderophore ABC transporter substrate-binding protein [Roseibium aggregatum]